MSQAFSFLSSVGFPSSLKTIYASPVTAFIISRELLISWRGGKAQTNNGTWVLFVPLYPTVPAIQPQRLY